MNPRDRFPIGCAVRTPYGLGTITGHVNVGYLGWILSVDCGSLRSCFLAVDQVQRVDPIAELARAIDALPVHPPASWAAPAPIAGRTVTRRGLTLRVIDGGRQPAPASTATLDALA